MLCVNVDFNADGNVNADDFDEDDELAQYHDLILNKLNEGLQTLNTFLWEVYAQYEAS